MSPLKCNIIRLKSLITLDDISYRLAPCIVISLTNNVMKYRENFNEASKYPPSIIIPFDGVKIIKRV